MIYFKNLSLDSIVYEKNGESFIEEWVDVLGYEGHYMVSNLGRVKSLKRKVSHSFSGSITMKERILKQKVNKSNYLAVNLAKDNIHSMRLVHRLVAIAFLENKNKHPEVNHKNGDTRDNKVWEIEWCSKSENILHSFRVLKRKTISVFGEKNPNYKNYRMFLNLETGVFYSVKDLAFLFNRKISGVRSMFYRNMPQTRNFIKV